ncbi:phosphoglucosamine mutase, partial [Streptococcus pyogenes]
NINAGVGSTHPEALAKFVVEKGADMGVAFDGDGDRCIAVDEKGNIVDGDKIMYICGKFLSERGRLKEDTVVTTVMSN